MRCCLARKAKVRRLEERAKHQRLLGVGLTNNRKFTLIHCMAKFKKHVINMYNDRAATLIQRNVRVKLAKRRVAKERLVVKMRGRSGELMVRVTFAAWSRPLKNRKRRLAATKLQSIYRGNRGRREYKAAQAAAKEQTAKVMHALGDKKMRTVKRVFLAMATFATDSKLERAATKIQAIWRARQGRKSASATAVRRQRAEDNVKELLGKTGLKWLRKCFKALRMDLSARHIQQVWRCRAARIQYANMRARQKKATAFMRRIVAGPGRDALKAWRGVLVAKALHRDESALCIQLAVRCYWAVLAWDARVAEKEKHEHLIATLLGEHGKKFTKLCYESWVACTGWDKAARVIQCRVRCVQAKAKVEKAREWRKHSQMLVNKLFGCKEHTLIAGGWELFTYKIAFEIAAMTIGMCYRRHRVAVRVEALRVKRENQRQLLERTFKSMELRAEMLHFNHLARHVVEYRAAEAILKPARARLALMRGRRFATATLVYSMLAGIVVIKRRRQRTAAALVVAQPWRAAVARARVTAVREYSRQRGEVVAHCTARRHQRMVRNVTGVWRWVQLAERTARQTLQNTFRCCLARREVIRRKKYEALLAIRLVEARAARRIRIMRTALYEIEGHWVAMVSGLVAREKESGDGDDVDVDLPAPPTSADHSEQSPPKGPKAAGPRSVEEHRAYVESRRKEREALAAKRKAGGGVGVEEKEKDGANGQGPTAAEVFLAIEGAGGSSVGIPHTDDRSGEFEPGHATIPNPPPLLFPKRARARHQASSLLYTH